MIKLDFRHAKRADKQRFATLYKKLESSKVEEKS